jgi:peptide/nickel transport system permease protein
MADEEFSPLHLFWSRFKKEYFAICGLIGILFLLLIAVYAPIIANGRPLILYKSNTLSFPFLHFVFSPDSTEVTVEQIFNFFMLYMPLFFGSYLLFRKKIKLFVISAFILFFLLLIPFFTTHRILDETNWRTVSSKLKSNEFALFAPVPYGPRENVAEPYSKSTSEHLLGTDKIGRDVCARMLYGARVSLAVGLIATSISVIIGTVIGLASGFFGGKFDMISMRIVEVVICFPTFLLLLILMGILQQTSFKQSILLVIAVIGFTSWTGVTRIVRGETLKIRTMPFIQSCETLAVPTKRILLVHILPNIIGLILINFSFGVAGAVMAESTLSFLGFGVQPPTSSWGELLRQAMENPFAYWHLTLWPGLALFLAVVSFNFAGEGLRKALDPKSD